MYIDIEIGREKIQNKFVINKQQKNYNKNNDKQNKQTNCELIVIHLGLWVMLIGLKAFVNNISFSYVKQSSIIRSVHKLQTSELKCVS